LNVDDGHSQTSKERRGVAKIGLEMKTRGRRIEVFILIKKFKLLRGWDIS
jgi:hypothetical protein